MIETIIALLNTLSLIVFFVLLAAGLRIMFRRAIWVWDAIEPPLEGLKLRARWKALPVLTRRAIVLYAGLAVFGGLILLVRVTGIMFDRDSIERLIFTLVTTFFFLGPLYYFTRIEYVLDNPEVK